MATKLAEVYSDFGYDGDISDTSCNLVFDWWKLSDTEKPLGEMSANKLDFHNIISLWNNFM